MRICIWYVYYVLWTSLFVRLCHRYDEVSTKVYETPADTQQLVELVEYVKEVSMVTFYQMNDEVKAAAKRLLTLLDYASFSGIHVCGYVYMCMYKIVQVHNYYVP